ncbi:hypothetical protein [Geodermatophilus sp. URMC 62]|uniref:hypothetical protein n=1 Tax=Geodermatophilus sp. URMC 62 TaxID=3423414 RepID=UPI00406C8F6A
MRFRSSPSCASLVTRAARGGVLTLAAAVLLGAAAPAASAAPEIPTLSLDSATELYYAPWSVDTFGPLAVDADAPPVSAPQPVMVAWGGSVTVVLPPGLEDDGTPVASLALSSDGDQAHTTLWYDNEGDDPAHQLTVTSLGGDRIRIDLPADDGVNGPIGRLWLRGLGVRDGLPVQEGNASYYHLQMSAGGPAAVTLRSELLVTGHVPGGDIYDPAEPPLTVAAGGAFAVTLPPSATLSRLGLPGLQTSDYALVREDQPAIPLTAALSADGRTATLTVPAGTPVDRYQLDVVVGDGTDAIWTEVDAGVAVEAAVPVPAATSAAAAPTTPAVTVNTGLRSSTGVVAVAGTGGGGSVAVGAGVGLLLLSGAGGVAVARARRRPAAGSGLGEA